MFLERRREIKKNPKGTIRMLCALSFCSCCGLMESCWGVCLVDELTASHVDLAVNEFVLRTELGERPWRQTYVAGHTPASPWRTDKHPALTGKQKRKDSPLDCRGATLHSHLENVHDAALINNGRTPDKPEDFGSNTQVPLHVLFYESEFRYFIDPYSLTPS